MNARRENTLNTFCFTDFDGKFHARLAAVIPRYFGAAEESKLAGTSARYQCRVKVEYQKDLMGLLEEGMLLAVKNFKQAGQGEERFTLMEISRVWPEHFGLRGLSDHGYYPMQFEIIEQSEEDWQTDDKSTMMIQIDAIPINYDLILNEKCDFQFVKGFSYPVVGSKVYLLNSEMINRMYNQKIAQAFGIDPSKTVQDARSDPRLGLIKMFQASETVIPIYVDFEKLVRYHFGVFAFTGGGKSNLMSNILRRILLHTSDTKVLVFDISCEYVFLLLDLLADPAFPAKVVMENKIESLEQFFNSVVKPREYEADERIKAGLGQIMKQGKLAYYRRPRRKVPTYSQFMDELNEQRRGASDKPNYINAIDEIHDAILAYMEEHSAMENQEVTEDFVNYIDEVARAKVEEFKVHEKSGLYAWGTTRNMLIDRIRRKDEIEETDTGGLAIEKIRDLLEDKKTRLVCISIADPYTIKDLVLTLTQDLLVRRKRRFQVKPYILLVFDEAQEFIPSNASGIEAKCSMHVETLLRQGRKYGLGACIATQRVAYLNTNALQQLHTYFVGTLPRPYDRQVISETFMLDKGILEKTLEFAPGEWLLSSYIATGMENVPIFIKADNAENEIEKYLKENS
ncbi:MAG: ATP-binding protein [Candidatus Bathyarchaeota archaeon]|nr:ATP-binding protein [Candidatus Bathyarchaeota archaeon A05DMB-5]MDH7558231.1 ATP-binding protein [Candidatus Bathyarchaeota archaeon]